MWGSENTLLQAHALSTPVQGMLAEAMGSMQQHAVAEALLLKAHLAEPDCLYIYYVLYKFYFRQQRLAEAEQMVKLGLSVAARQADIFEDWRQLTAHSCDWHIVGSPQYFYMYSLKAWAFIALRQEQMVMCWALLGKLSEIDPNDAVGSSVIRAYAEGAVH